MDKSTPCGFCVVRPTSYSAAPTCLCRVQASDHGAAMRAIGHVFDVLWVLAGIYAVSMVVR